jgi:hypothetical protein
VVRTFQVWNSQSNNLIDEFDTEAAALDEIRWRVERRGEDVVQSLALIGLDATDQVAMVIEGERLLCLVRERISLTA